MLERLHGDGDASWLLRTPLLPPTTRTGLSFSLSSLSLCFFAHASLRLPRGHVSVSVSVSSLSLSLCFFAHASYRLPQQGQGGNGGLSLRRRSKMLEIVRMCRQASSMDWNEGLYSLYIQSFEATSP